MPKAKLIQPNITNSEIEYDEEPTFLNIELDGILTLAHMVGWVDQTKGTRLMRVDDDGNLLVSTLGTQGSTLTPSVASVTTSATVISNALANRRNLTLYNDGSETVYLGASSSVLVATGYPLLAGSTYSVDNFVGAVWGIVVTTTTDVRVLEVV